MAVILVGAMIVGSIETVWHGTITPPHGKHLSHWYYGPASGKESKPQKSVTLNKGEELGRFNMGSTVILLFPEGKMEWDAILQANASVQMGIKIASKLQ